MRQFLTVIFTIICLCAKAQKNPGTSLPGDSAKITLTTKLGIPFGTICKVEAEMYYGDSLHIKAYEGIYLFKINAVNDKIINSSVILTFTDETGTLASAGKKFTIMAYETGRFTGMPDSYFKYRPVRADTGFHFEHYLVVVSNLTK